MGAGLRRDRGAPPICRCCLTDVPETASAPDIPTAEPQTPESEASGDQSRQSPTKQSFPVTAIDGDDPNIGLSLRHHITDDPYVSPFNSILRELRTYNLHKRWPLGRVHGRYPAVRSAWLRTLGDSVEDCVHCRGNVLPASWRMRSHLRKPHTLHRQLLHKCVVPAGHWK